MNMTLKIKIIIVIAYTAASTVLAIDVIMPSALPVAARLFG